MRIEHVKFRIDQQSSFIEFIKSAYQNLIQVDVEKITRTRISTRIEALREQWEKFSINNDAIKCAIVQLTNDERSTIEQYSYFKDGIYVRTYEYFLETLEKMNNLLIDQSDTYSRPQTSSLISQASLPNLAYHAPRLPRIDLPKFSGRHADWLPFRDLFTSLVITNESLSAVEKLQYLKTSLAGSAEHLLTTTALIADNFQKSWDFLVSFYENHRLLVHSALHSLFSLKRINNESASEIESLYTSIMQIYQTLETLKRPIRTWDDILVFIIVQRLDTESIKAWEIHLGSSKEPPTWIQIKDFLLMRMRSLQAIEKSQGTKILSQSRSTIRSHFIGQNDSNDTQSNLIDTCPLCSSNHYLGNCPQYQEKTPMQRKQIVMEKRCCFNCLKFHQVAKCISPRRCVKCGKRHHSSLHFNNDPVTMRKNSSTMNHSNGKANEDCNSEPKSVNHGLYGSNENQVTILPTAQIKVYNQHGDKILARALLDQGSEISLITESLSQRLRIVRNSTSIPVIGIGAKISCHTRGIASFQISPHFDNSKFITLKAHILSKLTSMRPRVSSSSTDWSHLKNLQLADPNFQKSEKIDIVIGADYYGQLLEDSVIKGPQNTLTAQLTKLGWIISGPAAEVDDNSRSVYHCSIDQDLQTLLEKFWCQEEIIPETKRKLTNVDQECENHFEANHSRDINGKYIVRLPFKTSVDNLGDSRASATRMLNHLKKKFNSSTEYLQVYTTFLKEYEILGHMVQINNELHEPKHAFYLPHHGVIKESSTTTKLRVVFNGSCHVQNGQPINELLHSGPKLQRNLFDVIVWMRQFKYMFCSDIEKMYRQIQVHEDDWKYQRIMWMLNNQLVKYQLTTVTYGLSCAPYLALRCLLQLIKDEGHKYPVAAEILAKGRYVDDVFGGADTIHEAQQKARQVFDLCLAGGFPLRKWSSNDPHVLQLIPSEYHTKTMSISIKDDVIQALGLAWKPFSDIVYFELIQSIDKACTKRKVLSQIAQFFDPLGLLSPIFIKFKIFMQELWAIKLGWDEQLPPTQTKNWLLLIESLKELNSISIPRWVGTVSTSRVELHGYCDASQLAMAAVIYIRTIDSQGHITVSLLCSKTKVSLIKRITIPRLELLAAVMVTKLMSQCQKVLGLSNGPCYLWSDSSIVNIWLNNHPSRWKDFVHNRVCYIQESLPNAQWRHVPGNINPADCATRGLTAKELKSYSTWWNGPHWLLDESTKWPSGFRSNHELSTKLEEKSMTKTSLCCVINPIDVWNLLEKYSSWIRLIRITAVIQRAIKIFKKQSAVVSQQVITPHEIDEAKKFWVKAIQFHYFSTEMSIIKKGEILPKSNPLVQLTPFLDHDDILRVGGRLEHSALHSDAKHPIILPKDNRLSMLIINDAHEKTLHGSTQDTLIYIRNHYWILGGRIPVRSCILKCVICTRFRRAHAQQLMGQLPSSRVNPSRAFLHTGVDYAGPFSIKTWKGRTARFYKSWVALFICLSTSAIHLELVSDYTSESFLAAYRRFIGRRGICNTLTSDCGTNFQGANKELKKLFSASSKEFKEINSIIANDGTSWNFNPPSTPHFGGKWEAGVKSMKHHLKRVMGNSLFTYEEFSTVLIQIEAVLNSRPLSPVTNDSDDLNVLTPGHFLIGQSLTLIPEPNLEHLQSSRLSRWQYLSQLVQSFWTKWSKEHLQRHYSIYKWNRTSHRLIEGTIVFIMDERYPPGKWALGRIIRLHLGADNLARVATVKTSSGIIKRPIVKLCPLNIASD